MGTPTKYTDQEMSFVPILDKHMFWPFDKNNPWIWCLNLV